MTPDDLNILKECIMKLMYSKKDIRDFLSLCGCDKSLIIEDNSFSRILIIKNAFDGLLKTSDQGKNTFHIMMKNLSRWKFSNMYHFNNGNLNLAQAKIHVEKTEELLQKFEAEEYKMNDMMRRNFNQKEVNLNFKEIKDRFYNLVQLDQKGDDISVQERQKRGYDFERIIVDIALESGLEASVGQRNIGEQIDGVIKFDGENYIFEAKWKKISVTPAEVSNFYAKVESKMYGRGIFFSMSGYSSGVQKNLVSGKKLIVLLMGGEDVISVLEERILFREMLDKKIRAAQVGGCIYFDAINNKCRN